MIEKWTDIVHANTMEQVWRSTPDHCHDIYLAATILAQKLKRASKREDVLKKIEAILAGIDATESDSDAGWWETSEGAKMGAEKLAQIRALLS